MPDKVIPFPKGLEGNEGLPKTQKNLENCFLVTNQDGREVIKSRQGIQGLNTASTPARGSFVWNGAIYSVFGKDLIKITDTDTGAFSVIGTIEGDVNIQTDIGFNDAGIVVSEGFTYTLDKFDVLTDVSGNANFVPFRDIATFNQRAIYVPTDGGPLRFSDVGFFGIIQPESFFDPETLPDINVAVFVSNNTLYAMGTDSIELFLDTGETITPHRRIERAAIRNGFIGGLLEYDATFLFIGRKKDQDPGMFAIGPGIAPKISNERIDNILSTYDESELSNAVASRVVWNGYDIATFTLARDSFGFFKGNWFKLSTIFDGNPNIWGAGFIVEFDGRYYTAFEERIGRFDNINTDYGQRINRVLNTTFETTANRQFSAASATLGISQGFNRPITVPINKVLDSGGFAQFAFTEIQGNTLKVGQQVTISGYVNNPLYNQTVLITATDGKTYFTSSSILYGSDEEGGEFDAGLFAQGSVSIQTSRDNVLFGPEVFRNVGDLGEYDKIVQWNPPGGLGGYRGFMALKFSTAENIDFSSSSLEVNN